MQEGRYSIIADLLQDRGAHSVNLLAGASVHTMKQPSRETTAGVSTTMVQNVDPEIKTLMLFLLEALRAHLPAGNAINQRSVNTLLKNHFRDIMELASKIRYLRVDELPQAHKGEITLTLESIEIKDSPMYIVIEGTATIWRLRHLHQH